MKRILIVPGGSTINDNPNLSAIIQILGENNYIIDILLPENKNQIQISVHKNSRFIFYPRLLYYFKILGIKYLKSSLFIKAIYSYFLQFKQRYNLIIGIDPYGIIFANELAAINKIPLGFISYEIFFKHEVSSWLKKLEIEACKNVSFAISQDHLRKELLSEENCINQDKIFNIPVAGRGTRFEANDFYLHDKYNITRDKKIAIYAGSIEKWTMADELLSSLKKWPNNWVLFFHHRYSDSQKLNKFIVGKLPDNLIISEEIISSIDGMNKIIKSGEVGIALYKPTYSNPFLGKNIEFMGLSSGKLNTYLQHGLPVIVNKIGIMSDYVKNNNLGQVINNVEDISDALKLIDRSTMKNNCLSFYENVISTDGFKKILLDTINSNIQQE